MKTYNITVNGVTYTVQVEEVNGAYVAPAPVVTPVAASVATPAPAPAPAPAAAPAAPVAAPVGSTGSKSVKAPMPGNIVKVNVKPGQSVSRGDVLLILEAMKMENEVCAPEDGVIASVEVHQGASVSTDEVLVTFN